MAEENEIVEEPKAAGGILPMIIVGVLTLVLGLAAGYFLFDKSVTDGDQAAEETT